MKKHMLVIKPDAQMVCIYTDAIRPLLDDANEVEIKRVSHVEPNEQGLWVADMLNGTCSPPFRLREEALQWEESYINNQLRDSGGSLCDIHI